MKISSNLLPNYHQYIPYISEGLEDDVVALLIIVFLHHEKKINDTRMKAMLNSLRNGTLLRRVKTYHSKINNEWYSDEHMINILYDIYYKIGINTELELDDFLKYLNLYLNANKNYCINWVFTKIFVPLFERNSNKLPSLGLGIQSFSYDEQNMDKFDLGLGYCCEDCDGDYDEYKMSRFENLYRQPLRKEILKTVKDYLLSKKKKYKSYFNYNDPIYLYTIGRY